MVGSLHVFSMSIFNIKQFKYRPKIEPYTQDFGNHLKAIFHGCMNVGLLDIFYA
jgi:hypothetical protein